MRKLFLLILLPFILACSNSEGGSDAKPPEPYTVEVNYYGALKEIMHESNLSSRIDLSELESLENLYALGAFENLQGEIQIFDGEVFNSRLNGVLSHEIEKNLEGGAALLVAAQVHEWNEFEVDQQLKSDGNMQSYIAEMAALNGIDTTNPFPFLLEGESQMLDWHIIDWDIADSVHTHEKHVKSGLKGSMINKEIFVLGFYSNSHHAIFTHHTTNLHMHFRSADALEAGHVDNLVCGEGMRLFLPSPE